MPSTHYRVACAQQTLFKQTILHPAIPSSEHHNLLKEFSRQRVESVETSMSRRRSLVNKESIQCDSSTNRKFIKLQIYYNKCSKASNVQGQQNALLCKNCYGARTQVKVERENWLHSVTSASTHVLWHSHPAQLASHTIS